MQAQGAWDAMRAQVRRAASERVMRPGYIRIHGNYNDTNLNIKYSNGLFRSLYFGGFDIYSIIRLFALELTFHSFFKVTTKPISNS
jgi:hypothetical protein